MKRFKRIYLELTNDCNLACSFCSAKTRPSASISPANLQRIIPQIAQFTDEIRPHLLGEPLLYQNLDAFIFLCVENSLAVKFTTNGTLLDERSASVMRSAPVKEINFSMHSYSPETHGSPDAYLETLFSFCDDQRTIDAGVYINFRFWNMGPGKFSSVHDNLIRMILAHYGTTPLPEKAGSIKLADRRYLNSSNQFVWPAADNKDRTDRGTCYGTITHIGILSDGTVVPCCLDASGVMNLGNIFETDLSSIVLGDRLLKMAEGFERNQLTEDLCRRCTYIERFGM